MCWSSGCVNGRIGRGGVEGDVVDENNGSRKRRAESVSACQLNTSAQWSDC